MSYTQKYSAKLKRDLRGLKHPAAREFLLKHGYNFSSFKFPEYYRPRGFLLLKKKPLRIAWKKKMNSKDMPKVTSTLDVLTPKSYLSWRSFNFLHPYIFWQIAQVLTTKKGWDLIKGKLCAENLVSSYSVPTFKIRKGEPLSKQPIVNWLQMAERDLIKDAAEYEHLITTDIENFYSSIYTHSIAWALHGRARIKKERKNYLLVGNQLDKLFQNAHSGQTNGIAVGSMVSDVIAEVILSDVDEMLSERIRKLKLLRSVLITRYRDDYRILSKTLDSGKRILHELNRILQTEYDLRLNAQKTQSFDDIVEGSFRPWMLSIRGSHLLRKIYHGDMSECQSTSDLKDCLIETYRIQKQHRSGRASISILSSLAEALIAHPDVLNVRGRDIPEIVTLLRKLTLLREEATPQMFVLLDVLLSKVATQTPKKSVLMAIKRAVGNSPDKEYQLIWFYRLCLAHAPDLCPGILKTSKASLVRVLNRKLIPHDYKIFSNVALSAAEEKEIQKFEFIERTKLKAARKKRIPPSIIRAFSY